MDIYLQKDGQPQSVPTSDADAPTSEIVLYADAEDFSASLCIVKNNPVVSPRVVVTTGRLKVGTDSYSIAGVTNVKADLSLKPQQIRTFPSSKGVRILAWISFCGGLLGVMTIYLPLVLLPLALLLASCAVRMSHTEQVQRTWVAKLQLSCSSKTEAVFVAAYLQNPENEMPAWIKNRGYGEKAPEAWKQDYIANQHRLQKIVEAVGLAIAKHPGGGQ